jgi:hypothetical protein
LFSNISAASRTVDAASDDIAAGLFAKVDIELFTYQIVLFSHAWALKAWRFRKLMSLQDYVERGLTLMLNPVLTPRGKRKFAQIDGSPSK